MGTSHPLHGGEQDFTGRYGGIWNLQAHVFFVPTQDAQLAAVHDGVRVDGLDCR